MPVCLLEALLLSGPAYLVSMSSAMAQSLSLLCHTAASKPPQLLMNPATPVTRMGKCQSQSLLGMWDGREGWCPDPNTHLSAP